MPDPVTDLGLEAVPEALRRETLRPDADGSSGDGSSVAFGEPSAPDAGALARTLASRSALRMERRSWWLRLRLLSPVSHHDPDQADRSNVSLFRRQAQSVHRSQTGALPTQADLDALAAAHPVPEDVADLFAASGDAADLAADEFVAAALVKTFIRRYGAGDGTGLFSGAERYRRLEERFQQGAVQAGSLFALWGHVCRSMQVPGAVGEVTEAAARLLTLPSALGQRVLRVLADTPAPVVMLARLWADAEKLQSGAYASAAGQAQGSEGRVVLRFDAAALTDASGHLTVQVPTYSANSLRHELVREPLLWHLYDRLGLAFDEPLGQRTALHYNGGDLKSAGSANVFFLRKAVRAAYPHLALLSGSTDSFLLGEGNLRVHAWLRCSENNAALTRAGLETDVSAFDLLDRVTHARHAGRLGGDENDNQMLFTFETLVPGAEIVVELGLTPYATDLEEGALAVAVEAFRALDGTLGGQSARGYGRVEAEWAGGQPGHAEAYEAHLETHAEALRQGVLDGTLTTGKVLITE